MRRKDRLMSDPQEIEALIQRALVCRLAMADENGPYVVPLCFGYHRGSLYFHTGLEGKKLDILEKNNNVCFEFDLDHEIKQSVNACEWSMKYKSVIGFGKATLIRDHPLKKRHWISSCSIIPINILNILRKRSAKQLLSKLKLKA